MSQHKLIHSSLKNAGGPLTAHSRSSDNENAEDYLNDEHLAKYSQANVYMHPGGMIERRGDRSKDVSEDEAGDGP